MKSIFFTLILIGILVIAADHFQLFFNGSEPVKSSPDVLLLYDATGFFNLPFNDQRFLSACKSVQGRCHITSEKSDFPKAAAVIFHNPNIKNQSIEYPLNTGRNLAIPYVLWSLESVANSLFKDIKNYFNWTMYFTKDADIWYPYGHIRKRQKKVSVDYDHIWNQKSPDKMAVWIGSNCRTYNMRMELMETLNKSGLQIDIFGQCGQKVPKNCHGTARQHHKCVAEVVKPYKFYMAIENSYCEGYVTEKFFSTVYDRDTIPIVGPRKIYEDLDIPSTSFIAIDDFKNLTDLRNYLNLVATNKSLYLSYFKWREDYEVFPEQNEFTGFCALCKKLISRDFLPKTMADPRKWQTAKQCNETYFDSFLERRYKIFKDIYYDLL